MRRITDFLFGKSHFAYTGEDCASFLTGLLQEGLEYSDLKRTEEGMTFSLPTMNEKKLLVLAEKMEKKEKLRLERRQGLPSLVYRYRKRPGILLGALLFALLLFLSQQFVMDIHITGNETLSEGEVLSMLEEEGFRIGSYLPNIDLDLLCGSFARKHGEVGWISVNMMGTVAEVEIREYLDTPIEKDASDRSVKALVAARDGIIYRSEVYSGNLLVETGQVVQKGQLLISCVTQTENRFHIEDAEGLVYAKVERSFEVFIPFEETIKVDSRGKLLKKELDVFGKIINFSSKGSILPSTCDTIQERQRILLFDRIPLPLFFLESYELCTQEMTVTRTVEEARAEALFRLSEEVERETKGSETLKSLRQVNEEDSGIRVTLTLQLIENIAVSVEHQNNLREDSASRS